ncbi:hypothetical protein [Vibrio sp. WXL210]|uniref:hypothetical protein n=1 Tax=Vibrio sp. WXL210 TaxID=3450709 RepID=UPI003EC88186
MTNRSTEVLLRLSDPPLLVDCSGRALHNDKVISVDLSVRGDKVHLKYRQAFDILCLNQL